MPRQRRPRLRWSADLLLKAHYPTTSTPLENDQIASHIATIGATLASAVGGTSKIQQQG
jgi:hypothetical protein